MHAVVSPLAAESSRLERLHAFVASEEPSPVPTQTDWTVQWRQDIESFLSPLAQEVLSQPGFIQVRVEYQRDGQLEPVINCGAQIGIAYLPTTSHQVINASMARQHRWALKIHAAFLPQWLSLHEAKMELEVLATQLADRLDSLHVRQQIKEQYQSSASWRGQSQSLRHLEARLSRLAHSRLPIILFGERGCGKVPAAMSLHCYRHALKAPFVQYDCRHWKSGEAPSELPKLAEHARGGSLYLAHADVLFGTDHAYLRDFAAKFCQQTLLILGCRTEASMLSPHRENTIQFVEWADFHGMSVHLPPLRERVADIRPLSEHLLQEERLELDLSTDAWETLESFLWPENGCQLNAVLRKAAALAQGALCAELLLEWFPTLRRHQQMVIRGEPQENNTEHDESALILSQRRDCIFKWFGLTQPENEHPALMRALEYIWKHYQSALTLTTVADKACVSTSHLSYLFKQRLQRSFKQILTEIRIDKAKHIFENMPARQITQVCMDVGFADLSHFEKTFKRMVGLKPRCYRQQFRQALSTQT